MSSPRTARRGPLIAILVIGVGLVLAPVVFQMFTRAPLGGEMIDEFEPFMTAERLDRFDGHIDLIDRAETRVDEQVLPAAADAADGGRSAFPGTVRFVEEWPSIHDDMGGLLADVQGNLDNYRAVAALPPFPLFPWFFVLPGLILAGLAWATLRRTRGGVPVRRHVGALIGLGVALVAAPAVFQMFTRAPLGAEMIDEFRPIMTEERVTTMQTSFVTIGAMEGELRNQVLPALDLSEDEVADRYPVVAEFLETWPSISNDMSPMIGAMSDNLDNFAAVDALPPFWLFPWFFVAPGVLVAGLGVASVWGGRRPAEPGAAPRPDVDTSPTVQETS